MKDNSLWKCLFHDLYPVDQSGCLIFPSLSEKYTKQTENGYEWDADALSIAPQNEMIELIAGVALYWMVHYQEMCRILIERDDLIDAEALLSQRMPDV